MSSIYTRDNLLKSDTDMSWSLMTDLGSTKETGLREWNLQP